MKKFTFEKNTYGIIRIKSEVAYTDCRCNKKPLLKVVWFTTNGKYLDYGFFCSVKCIRKHFEYISNKPLDGSESKNHIGFKEGKEYFKFNNSIYTAPIGNMVDIKTGYRTGARLFCTVESFLSSKVFI